MKKIIFIVLALVAAMTVNAQVFQMNAASLGITDTGTGNDVADGAVWGSMTKKISASAEKTDDICYYFFAKGKVAEVIQNPTKYKGNVIIPATVMHEGIEYDVKSIGSSAFFGCTGLKSVTIPTSVTSIGQSAFHGCTSLTSITIPNSVTSIGDAVFSYCSGLTSVTIPNSVTSIGYNAFYDCRGLTSVTIPNSVKSIGSSAFWGCSSLTSVTIGNSVTSIGNSAFRECSGLTSVTIPNSVTSIDMQAFYGCSGLTAVNIKDLEAWCKISFGDNPLKYAHHLYLNGKEIRDLVIPNCVTSIASEAFSGCSSLASITIGNSVTSISHQAFANCDELTDVYCLAENVPKTQPKAFQDSYPQAMTLHVPAASIEVYRSTEPWKQFKDIVAIEDGDIPEAPKCATPEINYVDGKVSFSCETEGVEYISDVTVADAKKYYDSEFTLSQTYKITVYAVKPGYDNSDVATREIIIENGQSSLFGDLNKDGKVDVADHVKLSDIIMNK